MRSFILFLTILFLLTFTTGIQASGIDRFHEKQAVPSGSPASVENRLGGDTVDDAVAVTSLPFSDTGTTCNANDDYDAACHQTSLSPDVVYSFIPDGNVFVDIDLCGSSYDTKVFVLDVDLAPIACSDDTYYTQGHPCGRWNAKLEFLALEEGQLYYIVIDGWGGECGNYELAIVENAPCEIACPGGAFMENEPPMQGGYDTFNAGCFSDWAAPMEYILPMPGAGIPAMICGVNGYYDIPGGSGYDHDWWEVIVGEEGTVIVTLEAQRTTNLAQLNIPDGNCDLTTILQDTFNDPCGEASLHMMGPPGSSLYFWVHTIYNIYPNGEYPYYLEVYGGTVAVERRSWSSVKTLYR